MNKPLLISGGANIALTIGLIVSILLGVKSCHQACPPPSTVTVISYRDSIVHVRDTAVHSIIDGTPELTRHSFFVPVNSQRSTVNGTQSTVNGQQSTVAVPRPSPLVPSCADTNFYSIDTMVVDSYRATATAIVSGNQLLNWDVKYANLAPERIRIQTVTTTKTEQPKSAMFKVFGGVFGTYKPAYWGLGVKAGLLIDDGYMINYGYDAKNAIHSLDFLMKISFKKQ